MGFGTLKATSRDNHSGTQDPTDQFGFIHFSDNSRVAYSSAQGVIARASGNGPAVTEDHVTLAKAFLAKDSGVRSGVR